MQTKPRSYGGCPLPLFVGTFSVKKVLLCWSQYVDEAIKIANRNTASETVRTLLVYGYVLDPPSSDQQNAEADECAAKAITSRTYRLEKNYAVAAGKW